MPCFARTSRDIVQVAELHLAVRHGVGLAVDDAPVEAGAVGGSDLVAEGVHHNFSLSTAVGLSERQYSVFRGFFRRFMQK